MKRVILIHSGICEDPLARFEKRTPLQVARHPSLDEIARHGRGGLVATIPEGCPPSSEIGTAVLLGWSKPSWPARAPLEALGRDLRFAPGTLVLRANFMTVADGVIVDHTAGGLATREAGVLVQDLDRALRPLGLRLHSGGRHRVLIEATNDELAAAVEAAHTVPPHNVIGRPVEANLPSGPGADVLRDIIRRSERVLQGHDVNRVRADLGENPATTLWPWGAGRVPSESPPGDSAFAGAFLVSDSPVIRGLGRTMGIDVAALGRGNRRVSYAELFQHARNALWPYDTVIVYSHRADDATHRGDAAAKIREIEAFDRELVSPLAELLRAASSWRLASCSDHRTLTSERRHSRGPTPLALAGSGIPADACAAFHEGELSQGSLDGRAAGKLRAWIGPAEGGTDSA